MKKNAIQIKKPQPQAVIFKIIKISLQLTSNYKIMPRPKGSQNKLTAEVKEQLQNLIDEVVNRIDVDSMTTDQKLKLLQLSLHYVLPKLRSTETTDKKQEDLPLFVD